MRNRNNNNNNNNNNNRRGQNPMTRVFESNGPDIKIRGTASHVAEKYVQLARDARSSGDPVAAENYYQHAEHYFRLIAAAQEQFRQNQPQPRPDAEMTSEDGDDGRELFELRPGAWIRSGAAAALSAPRQRPAGSSAVISTARTASAARESPRTAQPAAISAAAAATLRSGQWRRRSPAFLHHRAAAADQWWRLRGRQWRRTRTIPRDVAVVRTGRVRKAWPQALLRPATISLREMNSRRRAFMRRP